MDETMGKLVEALKANDLYDNTIIAFSSDVCCGIWSRHTFNTLRPRKDGRHFADDLFKCIFLNEYVWISIKISLKFVRKSPICNIQALVQIMAWRRSGDKPLSEAMMVDLLTHICVTRPQWVNHNQGRIYTLVLFYRQRLDKPASNLTYG